MVEAIGTGQQLSPPHGNDYGSIICSSDVPLILFMHTHVISTGDLMITFILQTCTYMTNLHFVLYRYYSIVNLECDVAR
jgi:hypothetical protein